MILSIIDRLIKIDLYFNEIFQLYFKQDLYTCK